MTGTTIAQGKRYIVTYQGIPQSAKVLRVWYQSGVLMVKFRVGWPIVGFYVVESLAEFGRRIHRA